MFCGSSSKPLCRINRAGRCAPCPCSGLFHLPHSGLNALICQLSLFRADEYDPTTTCAQKPHYWHAKKPLAHCLKTDQQPRGSGLSIRAMPRGRSHRVDRNRPRSKFHGHDNFSSSPPPGAKLKDTPRHPVPHHQTE